MLWSGDEHGHNIFWCLQARMAMYSGQSQKKGSYRLDTTVSLAGTSLFNYAIKLLCEKLGLFTPYLIVASLRMHF